MSDSVCKDLRAADAAHFLGYTPSEVYALFCGRLSLDISKFSAALLKKGGWVLYGLVEVMHLRILKGSQGHVRSCKATSRWRLFGCMQHDPANDCGGGAETHISHASLMLALSMSDPCEKSRVL